MSKPIEITPKNYATHRGVNKSYIHRLCNQNKPLDGVKKVKLIGRCYVLVLDKDYAKKVDENLFIK